MEMYWLYIIVFLCITCISQRFIFSPLEFHTVYLIKSSLFQLLKDLLPFLHTDFVLQS